MKKTWATFLSLLIVLLIISGCALEETAVNGNEEFVLRISAGLSPLHFWVGYHMDPFADRIEEETGGRVSFNRYYAGELVSVGRELDALGSSIDVAAPFLAPYHEGQFPLSDVTQLPFVNTTSEIVTKAFQRLMDSEVVLKDGQTFYQYEIERYGMKAWPLGVTGGYLLSTTGRVFQDPVDFKGVPLRAGSALHTMALESLGCTPIYMPSADAYEAMSRNTIEGIVQSIGDWISYGFEDYLTYSITGVNLGHWGSYLAMKEETYQQFPEDIQEIWDRVAREMALENARYIDQRDINEWERLENERGAVFEDISNLNPEVQDHISKAFVETWGKWIEALENEGHPGRAVAKLFAEFVVEEGGSIPDGVEGLL